MDILLTIIHLIACLILVVVVLLQKGKGADLAGAFGGGGSQTTLGVRTATQLIHKMTIAAAVFFMITSYTLGLIQSGGSSIAAEIGQQAGEAQPEAKQDEAKPAETTPAQPETAPAEEPQAPATEPEGGETQPQGQQQEPPAAQ